MADFYAGYISGAIGILLGSPLDILKVHLQSRSTTTTTTTTSSSSSSPSLFPTATSYVRGTAAPLLGYGCLNAILFHTYNRTLSLLSTPQQQQQQQSSLATIWTAGAVSGAVSFVLSAPVELVKVRAQTRPGENSYEVARGVVKREGVRGLYLGGGVTGVRDSAGYGFYFWAYEYMKRLLRYEEAAGGGGGEGQRAASMKTLLAGGVAGCVSWLSVYPLDVIKTRVQAQGECEGLLGNRRLGTWECAKSAYAGGGGRVFFNGLGVCMARAFLVSAVQWAVYEWVFERLK